MVHRPGLLLQAISALAFVLISLTVPATATDIYVPGSYSTIEAAIAAAANGDTIEVSAGTYTPAGGRLIINKEITIRAAANLTTKPIILTNYAGWADCAIQIAANNVVLEGFEIDNSASNANHVSGYIVGDYGGARNGWTVRNCDIHNGRNCIRPIGNDITIEYCNLHETQSDLINAEYGNCFGLKVRHNWLHSHHSDMGGKPAGVTITCTNASGADIEISYNYCWANRTFVDIQNGVSALAPANRIIIAHNTVDYWIGALPSPIVGTENAQQMAVAWWAGSGNWDATKFEIRDNLFTRLKWYAVTDTDTLMQGQVNLDTNLFWQWYLNDTWFPVNQYPHEWPAARGAVGWSEMGAGNGFTITNGITQDPRYTATGSTPEEYYALGTGSPALRAATDGTNIGAWQGRPPNSPPVADAQTVNAQEDVPVHVTLTGSDPDGDPLTFRVLTPPAHGRLFGIVPNLTYVAYKNWSGTDTLIFVARDAEFTSAPATVTFIVTPVNDPPVAGPLQIDAIAGVPRIIDATAVVTDVDGDPLHVQSVAAAAHGNTAITADGTVSYTAQAGYIGTDMFQCVVEDPSGAAATVTVIVMVHAPLSGVTLTFTPPDGQVCNQPIAVAAAATGGSQLLYFFRAGYLQNGAWHWPFQRTLGPAAGWTFTPTVPGTYTVVCTVLDTLGGQRVTATRSYPVRSTLTGVNLLITPGSPQPANTLINLEAVPTGGVDLRYRFWVCGRDSTGVWHSQVLQDYSPLTTCTWQPTQPGVYTVVVWVREATSRQSLDTYAARAFTVR